MFFIFRVNLISNLPCRFRAQGKYMSLSLSVIQRLRSYLRFVDLLFTQRVFEAIRAQNVWLAYCRIIFFMMKLALESRAVPGLVNPSQICYQNAGFQMVTVCFAAHVPYLEALAQVSFQFCSSST
jgi:hypothetical protein